MKTSKSIAVQLPLYLFAGLTTLMVEYGIFLILFYVLDLSVILANALSFTTALTVNFLLNKKLVFSVNNSKNSVQKQIVLYFGLALFNVLITTTGIHFLLKLSVPAFLAKLLLMGVVAGWNFVIFRQVIFRKSSSSKS